jgi:hypothetical protein
LKTFHAKSAKKGVTVQSSRFKVQGSRFKVQGAQRDLWRSFELPGFFAVLILREALPSTQGDSEDRSSGSPDYARRSVGARLNFKL